VAVGVGVLVLVAAASGPLSPTVGPARASDANHAGQGTECATCHGTHQVALAGGVPGSPPRAGAPGDAPHDPYACELLLPGSETATSASCLACHARLAHGGHPYDIEYPELGTASGVRSLRPLAEVLRRGLVLPDRQVRCVTCHDGNSPWRYHMKVPAGSTPTAGLDRRRPVTYENPETVPPPRPGDDIAKKPLCLTCHAMD
jgi:cytochrome c553